MSIPEGCIASEGWSEVPNVSASLSDEAYAIWQAHEGKRSPWVSKLIEEGDSIMKKAESLDVRVGYLMGLLSSLMTEVRLANQGLKAEEYAERTLILLGQCLDALDGTVHYYYHTTDMIQDQLEMS